MKIIKFALLLASSIAISSCASVAGQNTRAVNVKSQPAGAAVYVDNQRYGTTPTTVTLPDYIYGGKTITLKKKGYQDQSLAVNTRFQPIAILDVLFWPSIIVDGATGSLVKIDPANLNLNTKLERA